MLALVVFAASDASGAGPAPPACAVTIGSDVVDPGSSGTPPSSDGNVVAGQGSDSTISGSNSSGSNVAKPGFACWVDVTPYPFGVDGAPVDTDSVQCKPFNPPGPGWSGDISGCYLQVDSMAFRAWNRGIAATSSSKSQTTAFGVWLNNGTRWYPDPTFPGQSVCKGNTVLWAGKRDYWLIGSRFRNWPRLCRFDGSIYEWQPLDIPPEAVAHIPLTSRGALQPGAINAGDCFSWDNCWFFGTYGIILHWDGTQLTDATPDLAAQPWLATEYRAAGMTTDASGAPVGFVVGTSGGLMKGQQLPPQPDGSPPPQLDRSSGGSFGWSGISPPTLALPDDPYRTDLAAVGFDGAGLGWVAGNPVGYEAQSSPTPLGAPDPIERRTDAPQPSPLMAITAAGAGRSCPTAPTQAFSFARPPGSTGYLWSSVSTLPSNHQAVAGGQQRPASAGADYNDDASVEPVIVGVGCSFGAYAVRFRVPDPFAADQATAQAVPADRTGSVTSVAANANNDVWAATTSGLLSDPNFPINPAVFQRPHIYHLTDTATPAAPAGDDDETRSLVFEPDPPIIIEAPPDPPPPPPADTQVTQTTKRVRRVKLKPAIYHVRAHVKAHGRGTFALVVTFRVRRPVSVGLKAFKGKKLVGKTRLIRFKGKKGQLSVAIDRKHWPNRVRLYGPPKKKRTK